MTRGAPAHRSGTTCRFARTDCSQRIIARISSSPAPQIKHYSQCPGVDAIRVVWSEQIPPPTLDEDPEAFGPRPTIVRDSRGPRPTVFILPSGVTVACGYGCMKASGDDSNLAVALHWFSLLHLGEATYPNGGCRSCGPEHRRLE